MSTKASNQQQRRTPLSLTGGAGKSNQNQNSGKSAETNGNSNSSSSAKNDNKLSASQKMESEINNAEARESTPKDAKRPNNTAEKRQSQQQSANNSETAKKNEKVDEKKSQNGAGKAATNGGSKEKQQNGSDKQENGNSSNTRSSNTSSNSTAPAKSTIKSNEKNATTPAVKEETKVQEQKPSVKGTTRSNEKAAATTAAVAATVAKDDIKAEEPKPAPANEKNEKETEKEKEREKKKDSAPEKIVEKESRARRHDTAATETEKKQAEKSELPATRSSAAQPKARATPTKGVEKSLSSGTSTPTKAVEKSSASQRTRSVTTVIDDVEMDILQIESSPEKSQKDSSASSEAAGSVVAPTTIQPPAATSTPGKPLFATQQKTKSNQNAVAPKSEIPLNIQNSGSSPDRNSVPRTFTQIGGRRSIRPLTDYTPSKFQHNLQFRESYRRINTELDVSSTTNTSMNVTVGSEVPNSSSFSFFGRGRKRDRTPPQLQQSQSTMELQNDADYSPPKRARLDMHTFFSVVASPLTLLRSRFSKTSIQSSTPVKLSTKLTAEEDEAEVQNVSGISIEEEIIENAESVEKTATEDVTVGRKVDDDTTPKQLDSPMKVDEKSDIEKGINEMINAEKEIGSEPTNVHEVAAGVADTSVSLVKNKRCNVM